MTANHAMGAINTKPSATEPLMAINLGEEL